MKYKVAIDLNGEEADRLEAIAWLKSYNEDDVRATFAVRNYVRGLSLERGLIYTPKVKDNSDLSDVKVEGETNSGQRKSNPRKRQTMTGSGPQTQKHSDPKRVSSLQEFVESLVKKGRQAPVIESLTGKERECAASLIASFADLYFQPTSIAPLEVVSQPVLSKLVHLTNNYHLLAEIFIELNEYPVGRLALSKILKNIELAPNFFDQLRKHSGKSNFQELLSRIAVNLQSNTDEFKRSRWALLSLLDQSNPALIPLLPFWKTFQGKSDEFFDLDSNLRTSILKKFGLTPKTLLNFLFTLDLQHLDGENSLLLNKRLEIITIEEILAFSLEQINQRPWTFLENVLGSTLRRRLDALSRIEECMPYLTLESLNPGFFGQDRLERCWQRSIQRDDGLILLLQDKRTDTLNRKVEELIEQVQRNEFVAEEMNHLLERKSLEVEKYKALSQSYESMFRERASGEIKSQFAVERQIKIDQLKQLVQLLDPELSNSNSEGLLIVLSKLGVKRIGTPGVVIAWDPVLCEAFSGNAIEFPIVIRSGYTWSEGGEISTLLKALVKPGS